MAAELDSFVRKFKALCQAGRSASLNISSSAGKATVNLRVDLGDLHDGPHHPPNHSRNGPSRQRRRERRAAARVADAEKAIAALSVEEREVLEIAEEAVSKSPVQESDVPEKGSEEIEAQSEEEREVLEIAEDAVSKPTAEESNLPEKGSAEVRIEKVEVVNQASAAEVIDEVCGDSEYESRTPKSVEGPAKHPKPPPVRDRSSDGIKYYRVTYEEDPTDDEDDYIY